jgi:AraC-like DNA-binding protein
MASLLDPAAARRAERSCGPSAADWLRTAPAQPGLERLEACFARHAFAPHRHDTYAIGITLDGVQSFRYRGAAQCSTAGQVFVLHPDELHDGRAGTEAGYRYRILYVEPRLILEALDRPHRPLPFVRAAVSHDRRLTAALAPALDDLATPLEDLQLDQIVLELAEALAAADRSVPRRQLAARSWRAAHQARALLDASLHREVCSSELTALTGLSRFALDRARALIRGGAALAAALASGFADQSHMTRHFGRAYGISPGRWAALTVRPGLRNRDAL